MLMTTLMVLATLYILTGLVYHILMIHEVWVLRRANRAVDDYHKDLLQRAQDAGILIVRSRKPQMDA